MGKRQSDQPTPSPQDVAGSAPEKIATAPAADTPPAEGLSKIEAPELAPAAPAAQTVTTAAAEAAAAAPPPPPELPPVSLIEAPKVEAAASAPPVAPAPSKPESAKPAAVPLRDQAASAAAASWTWLKARPVTPLAASIAIAVVVGAIAGSVATAGLGALWASAPAPVQTADVRPLQDTIARINTELAALKASIENSGRTANSQLSRLGDRLERVERAQAEPAAKLAKLTEAVNKLEHHAPSAANPGNDVTGSISAPRPQPAPAVPVRSGPPIIDGWIVRSVYNGAALIQARYGGVIEVEPGDSLPQLGRIETIRRQDGRWVVVTSRGMIVAR